MSQPQANWLGHTIANRYKLEAVLGHGGMSTVYKAVDTNLHRTVAVKLIHPHLTNEPEFVRRFEQEAAAVARLRHPHIFQVYDFNHEGDIYYMVLEHVAGETLQDRLEVLNALKQRLPLAHTIQIIATITDTVAYAHEQGMIHRDLKPANVMLNPQGQPILMDFGVAKMLSDSHLTATGTIIGTARYMSPEQASGEHPDKRTDIYSLGVILYEMITGQLPFDGDSDVAILMKHVSQPVPDIRQIQSGMPELLVEIIEKALAKKPADRYQTATDMARALRAIDLHAPAPTIYAPASSTSSFPPMIQPVQQNTPKAGLPLWLIGGVAAIIVLVLGLGLLFVLLRWFRPVPEEQTSAPPIEQTEVPREEPTETPTAVQTVVPPVAEVEVSAEEQVLPSSKGMVKIAKGLYTVGQDAPSHNYVPSQQLELTEFWLDQYEVTNTQYAEFLAKTDHLPPASWPEGTFPSGQENYPVQGITWDSAEAYCTWANKRLPTEAEWEVAARGAKEWLYPWGDDQQAVKLPQSGTYEVGSIAANQSPFGVFDMAGNVWEWVGDTYAPVAEGQRVLHGGENGFLKDMAYRLSGPPDQESIIKTAGMRCAADQVEIVPVTNVLYEDEFVDTNGGWPVEDKAGSPYRIGYHPPDYYHVEVRAAEEHLAVAEPESYKDATVETAVLVDHTDTEAGDFRYGLTVRQRGEDQYYAFVVSSRTGSWQALKRTPAGLEVLAEGKMETLQGFAPVGFTPDKTDKLRVDAQGSEFVFWVNDQVVGRMSDGEYAEGQVGFYVETLDETLAHLHYDSLIVREVEALPEPVAATLYEDEFVDTNGGWPVEDEAGSPYRIGYHPPDYYHVEVRAAEEHLAVAEPESYKDATVETAVLVDHTDTEAGDFRYGLTVRQRGEDQYYAFTVSSRTGSWQALKRTPAGLEVLAEGKTETLQGFAPVGFTPDKTDKLRVDAQGSEFVFWVNDQAVGRVNDGEYAEGQVGFYVETLDETLAHLHYDSLIVREVEALPEPVAATLYEDEFVDTNGGWPVEDKAGSPYRIGYHPPDYYHVEVRAAEEHLAVAEPESYKDATVETAVLVDHTDTEAGDFRYGLTVRQRGEDQYYAFVVSSRTGSWQALKRTPAGLEVLAEGKVETLQGFARVGVTPDKTDKLRVDAQGSEFVFWVNDEVVGRVSDGEYAEGQVGFYVETLDETLAHLHYDSLIVREVEAGVFDHIAASATPTSVPAPEGMTLIPAGHFQMGASTGQAIEMPEHPAFLDAFYLDMDEVTNAQYRQCVKDLSCTQAGPNSLTRQGYRDDPAYDNYPVVSITWDQADAYCKWAGKHLPTEAQWEYAASGPENLTWPWGNTFKASLLPAVEADTQPVGSYPEGVSPFGVFDLAGNVAEWVADDYDEAFYANSPASNPVSANVSAGRIYRGGSFGKRDGTFYTTSRRDGNIRTYSDARVGLRCAIDVPELTPPEERASLVAEFCEVYGVYKPGALCP